MQFGRATAPDTFRLERTLKAPIEKVWSYFADGDKRAKWFTGGDALIANGQNFTITFAHHRITDEKPPARWAEMESGESAMTGRVLVFEPPHRLAITWGDGEECVSEVLFELTAFGDETRLVLTHTKIDTDAAVRDFAGGWTAHIEMLANVLDGKSTNRFWASVVEAHEVYERGAAAMS